MQCASHLNLGHKIIVVNQEDPTIPPLSSSVPYTTTELLPNVEISTEVDDMSTDNDDRNEGPTEVDDMSSSTSTDNDRSDGPTDGASSLTISTVVGWLSVVTLAILTSYL